MANSIFLGTGDVRGPGASTVGHVAVWDNATGTLLADGGGSSGAVLGLADGSYAAPSLYRASDPDTGLFFRDEAYGGAGHESSLSFATPGSGNNFLTFTSYDLGPVILWRGSDSHHFLELAGHNGTDYVVFADCGTGASGNVLQLRRQDDATGLNFSTPNGTVPGGTLTTIYVAGPENGASDTAGYTVSLDAGQGSGTGQPGTWRVRAAGKVASGATFSTYALGEVSNDALALDQAVDATVSITDQISGRVRWTARVWDTDGAISTQQSIIAEAWGVTGNSPGVLFKQGYYAGSPGAVPTYLTTLDQSGNFSLLTGTLNVRNAANTRGIKADFTGATPRLSVSAITGTDQAGVDFQITGGDSTGSGAPGELLFMTATAGSSGVSVNSSSTKMRVRAGTSGVVISDSIPLRVGDTDVAGAGSVRMRNGSTNGLIAWRNAANDNNYGIALNASNQFQFFGSGITDTAIVRSATFLSSGLAFASLPTGVDGMFAYITNSTTATWGATITGGGANKVLGFFNGTNWTVAGA